MPLSSWFKKKNSNENVIEQAMTKDDKLQLSLKCMQSQQTLEPIYDVSGCNASYVPDQTFTYCKLLRKTSLLLYDNVLTSLEGGGAISDLACIMLLDIHNNKISSLPNNIGDLTNLVKFNVSKNSLKSLPNAVASLVNLEELYLSDNEFSKVPKCLFALPKLCKLALDGNKIKDIPSEFRKLQSSLQTFSVDVGTLHEPYKSVYSETGTEGLMKYLCSESNIEYTGIVQDACCSPNGDKETQDITVPEDHEFTSTMVNYMKKKRQMMLKQMALEKERQERDAGELNMILQRNLDNKKQLCDDVLDISENTEEYEMKKQQQHQLNVELELQLRQTQDDEMGAYLANTTSKEDMLTFMSTLQSEQDRELESIVELKESEHHRLNADLLAGEKNTEAVMQEIVSAAASKNAIFVSLLEEQDSQMEELIATAAESAADVRQSEVLTAMQQMLAEAVMLENKARADGRQTAGWVGALIEDSKHTDMQLQDLLSAQQSDNTAWSSILLHDEECQAAAFKLLLLNNDLKRANILRQIHQVEHELVRLSSLEQRKALFSVQYGSTTMLHQRKTLVGMLKSLLSQKGEREQQLDVWLNKMEDIHGGGREATDYWLVQYQRLMDVKPTGLTKAEEQLDTSVASVLAAAKAMDVMPLFARYDVTFSRLLDMTEEDAAAMGVGPATYSTIQRALQHHLASVKLGNAAEGDSIPSAPLPEDEEKDDCAAPCAPSASALEAELEEGYDTPSAPHMPVEQYIEAECVICMENTSCIVLLPCGHVCTCNACSIPITSCPMCRAGIYNKIQLQSQGH